MPNIKKDLPVLLAQENVPIGIMKELNYNKSYQYSHNDPGNFLNQEFFSEAIKAPSSSKTSDTARKQELSAFLSKRCEEK